jgi:hypothetical protein
MKAVIVNSVDNALGRSATLLEQSFAYLRRERLQIALTVSDIFIDKIGTTGSATQLHIGGCVSG